MPKKKTEVYTLQRLLKEAHALLVKYSQIKNDHVLYISTDLTQQNDNVPVGHIYMRYSSMVDDNSKDLFAVARTPELCLADFEIQIQKGVQMAAVQMAVRTVDEGYSDTDNRKLSKLKQEYDSKGTIVRSSNKVIVIRDGKEVSNG